MERKSCQITNCGLPVKGRGLCQQHYDAWYGKIRRERDKAKNHELPFLRFPNPYRPSTGYHIIFEVIRNNKPMTAEQIARAAKSHLATLGRGNYRIDYALEVLKAKKHSSKRGDYQVKIDGKGMWHLVKE